MESQRFDLQRIRDDLPELHLDWRAETTSTNDLALAAAEDPRSPARLLLTDVQTAGRGRGENQWWSRDGSLTFSVLLDSESIGLAVEHWPLASLATGYAICRAVDDLAGAPASQVKWPNDVYLAERKLAGVLVETHPQPRRLIIGVGVNVNTRFTDAPDDIRQKSISLLDHYGAAFDLTTVLVHVVQSMLTHLPRAASDREQLLLEWRDRCFLRGRRVRIECPSQVISGLCRSVDNEGALRVAEGETEHRVFAGVVREFSPLAEP